MSEVGIFAELLLAALLIICFVLAGLVWKLATALERAGLRATRWQVQAATADRSSREWAAQLTGERPGLRPYADAANTSPRRRFDPRDAETTYTRTPAPTEPVRTYTAPPEPPIATDTTAELARVGDNGFPISGRRAARPRGTRVGGDEIGGGF